MKTSHLFLSSLNPISCSLLVKGRLSGDTFVPIISFEYRELTAALRRSLAHWINQLLAAQFENKIVFTSAQAADRSLVQLKGHIVSLTAQNCILDTDIFTTVVMQRDQDLAQNIQQFLNQANIGINVTGVVLRRVPPVPVSYHAHTILIFRCLSVVLDAKKQLQVLGSSSFVQLIGSDMNDVSPVMASHLEDTVFVNEADYLGNQISQGIFKFSATDSASLIKVNGPVTCKNVSAALVDRFGTMLRSTGYTGFYLSDGFDNGSFTTLE